MTSCNKPRAHGFEVPMGDVVLVQEFQPFHRAYKLSKQLAQRRGYYFFAYKTYAIVPLVRLDKIHDIPVSH